MLFGDCRECERGPSLSGEGGCERVFVALHPAVLNASGSLRLATSGGLFPSLTQRHKGAPICQHVRTTHGPKKQKKQARGEEKRRSSDRNSTPRASPRLCEEGISYWVGDPGVN